MDPGTFRPYLDGEQAEGRSQRRSAPAAEPRIVARTGHLAALTNLPRGRLPKLRAQAGSCLRERGQSTFQSNVDPHARQRPATVAGTHGELQTRSAAASTGASAQRRGRTREAPRPGTAMSSALPPLEVRGSAPPRPRSGDPPRFDSRSNKFLEAWPWMVGERPQTAERGATASTVTADEPDEPETGAADGPDEAASSSENRSSLSRGSSPSGGDQELHGKPADSQDGTPPEKCGPALKSARHVIYRSQKQNEPRAVVIEHANCWNPETDKYTVTFTDGQSKECPSSALRTMEVSDLFGLSRSMHPPGLLEDVEKKFARNGHAYRYADEIDKDFENACNKVGLEPPQCQRLRHFFGRIDGSDIPKLKEDALGPLNTPVGQPVGLPLLLSPSSVKNAPGRWDFMISYTQRNAVSEALAYKLHAALEKLGKSVWLDVEMSARDEAAMEEGVKNSLCVVAIVSGPVIDPQNPDVKPEDNAYFKRKFCLQELRWAQEAGVRVVPIVAAEDKGKITEFFADIPLDLDHLKSVNWEHIDRKDDEYFKLGVSKITKIIGSAGARK